MERLGFTAFAMPSEDYCGVVEPNPLNTGTLLLRLTKWVQRVTQRHPDSLFKGTIAVKGNKACLSVYALACRKTDPTVHGVFHACLHDIPDIVIINHDSPETP